MATDTATITITREEFAKTPEAFREQAKQQPVIITDDEGKPVSIILDYVEYVELRYGGLAAIAAATYVPGVEDIDLESVLPSRD